MREFPDASAAEDNLSQTLATLHDDSRASHDDASKNNLDANQASSAASSSSRNDKHARPTDPNKKLKTFIDELTKELTDPILLTLIDPDNAVIAADGHLYDKRSFTKWVERFGIRSVSPRTGLLLPSTATIACPQIKNIIHLLKTSNPAEQLLQQRQEEIDYDLAIQLHEDELRGRLDKQQSKISKARTEQQAIKLALDKSVANLQERLAYYEQMLSLKENELRKLLEQNVKLNEVLRQLQNTSNPSVALDIQAANKLLQVNQESNAVLDISSHHQLSPDALIALLKQYPYATILRSVQFGPKHVFRGHNAWCCQLIRLPDNTVISASLEPVIKQWNPLTWQVLREFRGHIPTPFNRRGGQASDLALSPSKKYFASAGEDATAIVWNLESGQLHTKISGHHQQGVTAVCFITDTILMTGSRDKRIMKWDLTQTPPTLMQTLVGHTADIYGIVYLQEKNEIVSVSQDTSLRVWNLATGNCTHILRGHSALTYTMIKTDDDRYVISGSDDTTIRIWDTTTWESKVLEGHNDLVNVLCMLDDNTLASGSEDETIKLWNIHSGCCIATISAEGKIWGLTALSDKTLVCGDTNGIMRALHKTSFDLSFRQWLSENCEINWDTVQQKVIVIIAEPSADDFKYINQSADFIRSHIQDPQSLNIHLHPLRIEFTHADNKQLAYINDYLVALTSPRLNHSSTSSRSSASQSSTMHALQQFSVLGHRSPTPPPGESQETYEDAQALPQSSDTKMAL